jgi:hypothetical protein
LADPIGDSAGGGDIEMVFGGFTERDLFFGIQGLHPDTAAYVIEFSGIVLNSDQISRSTRRLFKLVDNHVYDFDGAWIKVPPDSAVLQKSSGAIELKLSRRFLGDILSWPLWGIRVYSIDTATNLQTDSTSTTWLPSLLRTDGPEINITECSHWIGRNIDLVLQEISFGNRVQAEKSIGSYRAALNRVTDFLGESPLPTSQFSVLVAPWSAVPIEALLIESSHRSVRLDGAFVNQNLLSDASQAGDGPSIDFATDAEGLFRTWVMTNWSGGSQRLREALTAALTDQFLKENIGLGFWLDHFPQGPQFFAEIFLNRSAIETVSHIDAKTAARDFGHFLGLEFATKQIMAAWREAEKVKGAESNDEIFYSLLLNQLSDDSQRERLKPLADGWLNGAPYNDAYKPVSIGDSDSDGLFDYYELIEKTNPQAADSDSDGWTDVSEILAKTDPTKKISSPNSLILDGNFDDWLQLVPQRIHTDLGATGDCPKSGDIVQYSAIAGKNGILIGANTRDFWRAESTGWVVTIEAADGVNSLRLNSKTGSRVYSTAGSFGLSRTKYFFRAIPSGVNSAEWLVKKSEIPPDTEVGHPGPVRINIATVYFDGTDKFCDETGWFSPLSTE